LDVRGCTFLDPRIWPVSKSKVDHKPKLNRREAFQTIAADLDATFVAGKPTSRDKVHLDHGPWNVILDTYVLNRAQNPVWYTRVRALYVAREDFTLRISRRNVYTRIAELFGRHGLRVGDQELQRKYAIKSSNDRRGQSLMMDGRLRALIKVQPSLGMEIRRLPLGLRREMGDGVRAVAVQTPGVIAEPDRLVNYVLLVAATLDRLVKIGGAFREPVAEGRTYTLRRRA
jgi:hypothetical protein